MPQYRIVEAAELLGVSDDTIRRWIEHGKLLAGRDQSNVKVVDGASLAAFVREHARPPANPSRVSHSARNRLVGLITEVTFGSLMTQVEIYCPPHRVVSLVSTEAARELGLAPGQRAVAIVKATHVTMETVIKKADRLTPRGAGTSEGTNRQAVAQNAPARPDSGVHSSAAAGREPGDNSPLGERSKSAARRAAGLPG